MVTSFQNKKALLIGNGVNRLDTNQSISWSALLQDLKKRFSINVELDNEFKPFPLAFDEMLHQKRGSIYFNDNVKNLKQYIRKSIEKQLQGKRGFNDFHYKLATLGYDDILTTNYDYSFQKSVNSNFIEEKKEFAQNKQESKFSLKRSYYLPNHNLSIWHIHGELFDSRSISSSSKYYHEESIMIGYEHYSSYLERIQENIWGKSGRQPVEYQSLMVRLRNEYKSPFWMDIFFTHNLDIIGLGLDFSENHLWWLFNFRANEMRKGSLKNDIRINNTIRFFYPTIKGAGQINVNSDLDELVKKRNNMKKSKAIAEVLKAFEVEPKLIHCESYTDFYEKLTNTYLLKKPFSSFS